MGGFIGSKKVAKHRCGGIKLMRRGSSGGASNVVELVGKADEGGWKTRERVTHDWLRKKNALKKLTPTIQLRKFQQEHVALEYAPFGKSSRRILMSVWGKFNCGALVIHSSHFFCFLDTNALHSSHCTEPRPIIAQPVSSHLSATQALNTIETPPTIFRLFPITFQASPPSSHRLLSSPPPPPSHAILALESHPRTMSPSPISSPRSPRHSDISFTSVHAPHSERRYSPPSTASPAHLSTSTISRDSHASADDRPLTKVPSIGSPFLQSSTTRIPKARVFLHREQRPDRPKRNASQSGHLPSRTHTPTNLSLRSGAPTSREKRCVSDLHDAFQAHQLRVERTVSPTPQPWARRRGITDINGDSLGNEKRVPQWIPNDEAHDWNPSPKYDPCAIEDEPSSKWTTSLRHISNLYKKDRTRPCIRGSILEVQPPTLTERLGLGTLGAERRTGYREMPRVRNPGRVRMNRRSKGRYDELTRRNSPTDVTCLPDDDRVADTGRDDYVGFLIQAPEEKVSRPKKGWLRFLRRSRA